MATYTLVHGAGGDSWYWHLVAPQLRERGHEVVTPDLPTGDDAAGWTEYADVIEAAIGDRRDVILVAQSMAGFSAPLVCQRRPIDLLVLVAAMVPRPGETGGDWWEQTGQPQAERALAEQQGRSTTGEVDPMEMFFHDLPAELAEAAMERGRPQSATPFTQPWPLERWPDTPTRFLLARRDRLFPAEFQRRVVAERLGIVPDELDAGHLPALSCPDELVAWLERYRADLADSGAVTAG